MSTCSITFAGNIFSTELLYEISGKHCYVIIQTPIHQDWVMGARTTPPHPLCAWIRPQQSSTTPFWPPTLGLCPGAWHHLCLALWLRLGTPSSTKGSCGTIPPPPHVWTQEEHYGPDSTVLQAALGLPASGWAPLPQSNCDTIWYSIRNCF